jgi:hypothetical protein
MVNKYMLCPAQARFRYIEKLEEKTNASAVFGSIVHKCLEEYNQGLPVDRAVDTFIYWWDNPEALGYEIDIWPKRVTYGGLRETGAKMIRDYDESFSWSKGNRIVIATEHEFEVPFGDHTLYGFVDLLEYKRSSKHKLKIVDWKAQPLYSKILTPQGWIKMGDVNTGDYVIGSDGNPTEVLGVYPQGDVPLVRVTFNDGSMVECSDEHWWQVRHYLTKQTEVLRIKDILAKGIKVRSNRKWFVPTVQSVEYMEGGELPIDPYIMGILISEGSLTKNGCGFTNGDAEVIANVASKVPPGYKVTKDSWNKYGYSIVQENYGSRNMVVSVLREVGLYGTSSLTRFIPEIYLRSSVEDRKALLAGLVDGDGTSSRRNVYNTSSPRLKDDFIELCRSLGGTPRVSCHDANYTKVDDEFRYPGSPNYHISFRLPFNPFGISRKKETWKAPNETLDRAIDKIEYVGLSVPMQCIKVKAPDGLYVTDDFILTHNTGKQPNYDSLYLNCQMTIYYYASMQPEFWDTIPNGDKLFEQFTERQVIWHNLKTMKEVNAGKRDDDDFMRLYLCCKEIAKAIEHDVFVPSISGESCTLCSFTKECKAYIEPKPWTPQVPEEESKWK